MRSQLCNHCGNEFSSYAAAPKYCSKACSNAGFRKDESTEIQPGDPTPGDIEARSAEVRDVGFSLGGKSYPPWDANQRQIRRDHEPVLYGKRHDWDRIADPDAGAVEVIRHSVREFHDTLADKRMSLYEWG